MNLNKERLLWHAHVISLKYDNNQLNAGFVCPCTDIISFASIYQ